MSDKKAGIEALQACAGACFSRDRLPSYRELEKAWEKGLRVVSEPVLVRWRSVHYSPPDGFRGVLVMPPDEGAHGMVAAYEPSDRRWWSRGMEVNFKPGWMWCELPRKHDA